MKTLCASLLFLALAACGTEGASVVDPQAETSSSLAAPAEIRFDGAPCFSVVRGQPTIVMTLTNLGDTGTARIILDDVAAYGPYTVSAGGKLRIQQPVAEFRAYEITIETNGAITDGANVDPVRNACR